MSSYVDVTPELMAGFLDEAPEYLTMLDEGLLAFESGASGGVISMDDEGNQERMNEMFRAAHSLKGLAATMGFDRIRDLTHLMETLFDRIRGGQRAIDPATIEALFGVFDKLRELVDELSEHGQEQAAIDGELATLEGILGVSTKTNEQTPPSPETANAGAVAKAEQATSAVGENVAAASSLRANIVSDDPELVQLFIDTTTETLEQLSQELLKLEQSPDDSTLLNNIFRCAHNIKGATGAAGLDALYHLTHDMETVLDRLRANTLALDEQIVNALFRVVDRLRSDVEAIRSSGFDAVSSEAVSGWFIDWLGADAPSAAVDDTLQASVDTSESCGDGDAVCVQISFPKDFAEAEIQAYLVHNRLAEMGDVLDSTPDLDALDGSSSLEHIVFTVRADVDPKQIEEIIGAYSVESVRVTSSGQNVPDAADETADESPSTAGDASKSKSTEQPSAMPSAPESSRAKSVATGGSEDASENRTVGRTSEVEKPAKAAPAANTKKTTNRAAETIRVDLDRLDELMNLGGELVINKARLAQIHSQFAPLFAGRNTKYVVDDLSDRIEALSGTLGKLNGSAPDARDLCELTDNVLQLTHEFGIIRTMINRIHGARSSMNDFSEAIHGLSRVSEGMQRGIMATRMVSIGPLFQRFRRVVRDLSKSTQKEVELVLRGEATELDKRMIDELGDPLTHMVRNSIDHGVELPEVRERLGKPRTAKVVLDAYHRGRHICLEIRDDGAGVDTDAVKKRILERELATAAQVEAMSDKEIVQYVFRPGFSTAEQVTDLSGRGMGMDIVINKIDGLNGVVEIDSVRGKGTVVTIKLPLTLAIMTALVARIGKGVYAVPLESVAEIITVQRRSITSIQKQRVVRVRDHVIPIAFFENVFATSDPDLRTTSRNDDELTLIILNVQEDRVGLVVDEMIGQEDVVIKSLAANYKNIDGVVGASIRGDGGVSLILDVATLIAMFADRAAAVASMAETFASEQSNPEQSEVLAMSTG